MVNESTLVTLGLGLVVASIVVALIVVKQSGSTPRLAGEISQVRTLGMDPSSSVAIADFRFTNSSRYTFIVQSSDMAVVDAKGETKQGQVISADHVNQLFELFPALGPKKG